MLLYSASTNGFYLQHLHGNDTPDDVVEISTEEHRALLDGQTAGKLIAPGKDGKPTLKDRDIQVARKRQASTK